VVMSRPFFIQHTGLIRVFMRAVWHARLDKECPCAHFCKILETVEKSRRTPVNLPRPSRSYSELDAGFKRVTLNICTVEIVLII
jgi:hypothetical protein